jgi:membrane associated rhomboid family serine protease
MNSYFRRSQMPATLTIIAINAVLFLFYFFDRFVSLFFTFIVPPFNILDVWTLFAYPLLTPNFFRVVFGCLWLVWVGGSLERSWGTFRYTIFFFALTAISGLGLFVGSLILHSEAVIVGLWIPVTSMTVAWATINPLLTVMIYGLIPVQARWIAIFEVGVIYFVYYDGAPLLGLFALLGPLAAYVIVKMGLMTGITMRMPRGPDLRIVGGGAGYGRPLDDAGIGMSLNPLNRIRSWQQRRRLAKLLQKSGFTNRDDDQRRK